MSEKDLLWISIKQILRNQQLMLEKLGAEYDAKCTIEVLNAIDESNYLGKENYLRNL